MSSNDGKAIALTVILTAITTGVLFIILKLLGHEWWGKTIIILSCFALLGAGSRCWNANYLTRAIGYFVPVLLIVAYYLWQIW